MPTRRSMVAAADERRRSRRSWRASRARFSARRSRVSRRGGIEPFSGFGPAPVPASGWTSPAGGEEAQPSLQTRFELGLLSGFAHAIDPLAHFLAALLPAIG